MCMHCSTCTCCKHTPVRQAGRQAHQSICPAAAGSAACQAPGWCRCKPTQCDSQQGGGVHTHAQGTAWLCGDCLPCCAIEDRQAGLGQQHTHHSSRRLMELIWSLRSLRPCASDLQDDVQRAAGQHEQAKQVASLAYMQPSLAAWPRQRACMLGTDARCGWDAAGRWPVFSCCCSCAAAAAAARVHPGTAAAAGTCAEQAARHAPDVSQRRLATQKVVTVKHDACGTALQASCGCAEPPRGQRRWCGVRPYWCSCTWIRMSTASG